MDSSNKYDFANDYQVWLDMINSMVAFISASTNLVNNINSNLQNFHAIPTIGNKSSIEYFPVDFPCYLNSCKKTFTKVSGKISN